MSEVNTTKFEDFFKNDFEKIKDKIFSLDSFGVEKNIRVIKEEIEVKDNRPDWIQEQAVITMLDMSRLNAAVQNNQFLPDENLTSDLSAVAAFLNQAPATVIYEVDKLKKIISGEDKDFDKLTFVFSLRQDVNHPDGRDAAFYFIKEVLGKIDTAGCDWYWAVVYTILLHIAFKHFDSFDDDTQTKLLKKGFFKAVLAGVPVREVLAQFLYDTNNVSDLLIDNQLFHDALLNNEEKIDSAEKKWELKTLMSEFVQKNEDDLNKDLMEKYISEIGLINVKEQIKRALLECVNIYALVNEVKLIDHNSSQDLPETDLAQIQTEKLLLLFANRVHWPEMLEYFTDKEGNYVSAELFIKGFKDTDLNDEAAVEKLTAFGEFLKTKGFLAKDQEILEFHEADNKFHWAEWINK